MGRPDKDYTIDESWYSVQFMLNGTWVTEKARIDEWEEASELAWSLQQYKANAPRVRIRRHELYSEEV